jgi:DNA replication protein DnaC
MEITNHNHSIDVEKLKSQILQRRTIRDRFKFPLPKEEIYDYLLAALQAEVTFRHREFIIER